MYLGQLEGGHVSLEFVPLARRRYLTPEVDITGQDPAQALTAFLQTARSEDIVRLALVGERDPDREPDLTALTALASGYFYSASLTDRTTLPQALWARQGRTPSPASSCGPWPNGIQEAPADQRPLLERAVRFGLAALEGRRNPNEAAETHRHLRSPGRGHPHLRPGAHPHRGPQRRGQVHLVRLPPGDALRAGHPPAGPQRAPADKNRYRPWNGKPMEGLLECEHQGAVILRAGPPPGVPMGDFSAVYQATGLPVPGLTADNAGEVLTGLSREVFDRSVFLRQTALAVTQSQDLEKRITDLVSSGEEDVSWSEANDRLKAWLHRRRFHKSGRIPLLEAEAAQLRQTVAQTAALRQDLAQQQARAATLRRQADHWDKRLSAETDKFQTVSQQRYAQAAAELDAAQLHLQTLQAQQSRPRSSRWTGRPRRSPRRSRTPAGPCPAAGG